MPQYQASAFNPVYGDSSTAPYQFFAHNSGDVLQRVTAQLLRLDPTAKLEASPDDFRVQASVTLPGDSFELEGEQITTPGASVQFTVHVLQAAADDEDTLVVAFARKMGAVTAFQTCFSSVRDQFEAELDLTGLNIADGKGMVLQEEELELSEDLGMI